MRKTTIYIFMITLTAVLLTACGSKRNDTITDMGTEAPLDTGSNTPIEVPTDTGSETITKAPADTESDMRSDAFADTNTIISETDAMNAALKDANLLDSEISRLHIKLERDDGIPVYEVDFYSGEREYDYEIDAASGRILERDNEPID